MATLDFDYTPARATGTTASIIATATWAFDVNTPVVASAVRVSDGVVVSPAVITAKDYQTKQFTVTNPWGNGVQATVVVERRVVPTQEFDPSTTENLNLRSLSAQLAETTKALAQVYAFTYGNAVLAQPGLGIWSYDVFQVAPIGARKGKIIRFDEVTGAPVYVVSALTEEESEYLYNHTHPISDVVGLQAALDGKAPLVHTHTMEQVLGLVSALAGKAPLAHTHQISDVVDLQTELDSILAAIAGINPGYGEGDDANLDRIVCTSLEAQEFAWGKEALAVGSTQQWVLSVVAASPNGHALQFQYKAAINAALTEYVRLDTQGFRPGPAAGSSLWLGTPEARWAQTFSDIIQTNYVSFYDETRTGRVMRVWNDADILYLQEFNNFPPNDYAEDYVTIVMDELDGNGDRVIGTGYVRVFRDIRPVGVRKLGAVGNAFSEGHIGFLYGQHANVDEVRFGTDRRARVYAFSNVLNADTVVVSVNDGTATPLNICQFETRGIIPLGVRDIGDAFNRWRFIYGDIIKTNWVNFFNDVVDTSFSLKFQLRGQTLYLERWNGSVVTHELARWSVAGGFVPVWPAGSFFEALSATPYNPQDVPQQGALMPAIIEGQGQVPEAQNLIIESHARALLESATPAVARTAIGAASATDLAGKANTSHTHSIANVTGLQTALDGKAATNHTQSPPIIQWNGGNRSLLVSENNSAVYVGYAATPFNLTLPPAQAGLFFDFVIDMTDQSGDQFTDYKISAAAGDGILMPGASQVGPSYFSEVHPMIGSYVSMRLHAFDSTGWLYIPYFGGVIPPP